MAWPLTASADDDPNTDYLFRLGFAEDCKRLLPALSKQLDSAVAAWQSRMPAAQLAALRAYADSKPGKRMADGIGAAIASTSGEDKLLASYECPTRINDWGRPVYPAPSKSQIDAQNSQRVVATTAPLVLGRLDCSVLDGIEAEPKAAPATANAEEPMPAETWRFSACGRSHEVGIDRRGDRYGLAAKDRFELAGLQEAP
ncbi:hypothetical protein LVB77_05985 [Lysobacter sp. 5GHs7-4]|uniref:hypothetical protein n=1 Tax=Lysobacter sp. 5GHs7-4 TaxID=2904253 RepID=UPI001E3D07C6|nr:hypothetical protein [Lysobacter sp. 5GHs7-4]UHQ24244.1 hypothetical protein LVB77_05985 [Lysobacter sp. 5GHs7-4]